MNTNQNVVTRLHDLRRREHECTVEIVQQLVVCHRERAYLEHGCSSLFDFLVEELTIQTRQPHADTRR